MNDLHMIQQFVFTLAPLTLITSMILGMISTLGGFALKIVEINAKSKKGGAADDDAQATGGRRGRSRRNQVAGSGTEPDATTVAVAAVTQQSSAGNSRSEWNVELFE